MTTKLIFTQHIFAHWALLNVGDNNWSPPPIKYMIMLANAKYPNRYVRNFLLVKSFPFNVGGVPSIIESMPDFWNVATAAIEAI